jgi:glyoxylase-like metal-dependent hydrolase (beta-lactamase superfamily II)
VLPPEGEASSRPLRDTLLGAGLYPSDIDVFVTHLHFDHAGGFTERDP